MPPPPRPRTRLHTQCSVYVSMTCVNTFWEVENLFFSFFFSLRLGKTHPLPPLLPTGAAVAGGCILWWCTSGKRKIITHSLSRQLNLMLLYFSVQYEREEGIDGIKFKCPSSAQSNSSAVGELSSGTSSSPFSHLLLRLLLQQQQHFNNKIPYYYYYHYKDSSFSRIYANQ